MHTPTGLEKRTSHTKSAVPSLPMVLLYFFFLFQTLEKSKFRGDSPGSTARHLGAQGRVQSPQILPDSDQDAERKILWLGLARHHSSGELQRVGGSHSQGKLLPCTELIAEIIKKYKFLFHLFFYKNIARLISFLI